MGYDDLFLLSLASSRMLKLLQLVPWKHIKAISYKTRKTHISVFAVKSQNDSLKVMELRPSKTVNQATKQMMHCSGYEMTYCPPSDTNKLIISFNQDTIESTVQFVHQYMSNLFGDHLQYGCTILSYDLIFLPAVLPIKSNVLMLHMGMDPECLNDYISKMENQKCFTMKNQMKKLPLNNMKFHNSQHLNFINAYSLAPEIVSCFEGRTAVLYNSKIENSNIVDFVIRWQQGETAHNLKFLKIYLDSTHVFNPDVITRSLDIRKFTPSREPPRFQFPVINFFGAQETLQDHDLTMNTYVVRESDQIISSISISEDRFDFCVWEWTEKQTAEMGYIDKTSS